MHLIRYLKADALVLTLIAVMLLTRNHHFGDALHLPDASLAVFFFAGYSRKTKLFGFLLALAALIDYLAIANGASGWCLSPAYLFLLPAYAVMWLAGRYSAYLAAQKDTQIGSDFAAIIMLSLSASIAFIISNGSYYLFSGHYPDTLWSQYLARVAGYYPPYLRAALIYGICGIGAMKLINAMASLIQARKPAQ